MTRHLRRITILIPLFFLAAFFFYPLFNIFRLSLTAAALAKLGNELLSLLVAGLRSLLSPLLSTPGATLSISSLMAQAYYLKSVWFTTWQAAVSTLLTLIVGLPAAYLFARFDFRGKSLLRSLTTVPFVMPTVVVAAAFRALLGVNGPLNQGLIRLLDLERAPIRLEQTILLILLAHVFYNVTVVVRLVGGFWANLNPRIQEAATMLGASPTQLFVQVTLPLLRPALVSATTLIFLFTFTSFGVILILGGPAFSTLETEIYRQYVTFLRPDVAAVLSLLQILFTFGLMSAYARWQQQATIALDFHPRQANLRRPATIGQKLFTNSMVFVLFIFLIAPLLALLWRSLIDREGQFTLAYYQSLPQLRRGSIVFVPPLVAIRNSAGYAMLTVITAGFLGLLTANLLIHPSRWRNWLDPIFMLPLGVSAVTLGFGYVVSYDQLRTSPLLVLIAHTLVAFPFVVRSLLPVLQGIKPNLREAAAVLGAPPGRVWREVDLPIVGRALLVAAVFAFTVSMGEFGATSFIVRPNSGYLTLPIAIQRYLSQPGALNFGQAMALSTILMVVCATGFIAIERFRYANIGEF